MSFEMAQVSTAGGNIETASIKPHDSSSVDSESQSIKIYVITNKDYNMNICAIIEGVYENVKIDQIDDAIDYETLKKKPIFGNEDIGFDVLIYGRWKGEDFSIDLEVMVEDNFCLNNETKKNVYTLSKQLLNSIKSTFKKSSETELMFCLECGRRLKNKIGLVKHVQDFHDWGLSDVAAMNGSSDAVLIYSGRENSHEFNLLSYKRTDWLEQWNDCLMPSLMPSFDHITENNYQKDVERAQSPPLLSILPSWTHSTSPCANICNICDGSFASSLELDEHLRSSHPRSSSPSSRNSLRHFSNREYRCNICNYKTITKGNLHIHFQSEKHRNNQREHDQNEQKSRVHNHETASLPPMGSIPSLHLFDSLLSRSNQFFSTIKSAPFPTNWSPNGTSEHKKEPSLTEFSGDVSQTASFECDICHNFSSQDTDAILEHAERPRPLPSNSEVSKVIRVAVEGTQGTELEHLCLLDGYKTRIKANFLLHFKTEKHQQKLQLLAHAREGGMENANKIVLQMVTEPTPLISIRCSLCRSTFSTAHKLRLHVESSDHQINQKISASFHMWKKSLEMNNTNDEDNTIAGFECLPCGAIFRRFIDVLDHFQNQRNNIHMAFFKKDVDINSLVKINYINQKEIKEPFVEPRPDSVPISSNKTDSSTFVMFRCYLCNDAVDRKDLKCHLKEMHKIQENCVDQLVNLAEKAYSEKVDSCSEVSSPKLKMSSKLNDWCDCIFIRESTSQDPMVRCQQCGKCFATIAILEEHKVVFQHVGTHDPRGHLCYKRGCNQYFRSMSLMIDHFYEIHASQIVEYKKLGPFKHVCKACHLFAFACPLKYAQHVDSHCKMGPYDCIVCGVANTSRASLRVHIDSTHVTDEENAGNEKKILCNDELKMDQKRVPKESHISPQLSREDSKSSLGSPESIINKENCHVVSHAQGSSEQVNFKGTLPPPPDSSAPSPFVTSWSSIASLIQTVGLENVKLVIETMINSKYEHNEKDSLVWKFAESIINIANIQETLVEKCLECGKMFSCSIVLRKHSLLCTNASRDCLNEFEKIVILCRDHLTRMMISLSSEAHKKPFLMSANSHSGDTKLEAPASKPSMQYCPRGSGQEAMHSITSKLQTPGLMNFNRSILQPMLHPYRFPPTNHSFLNILPPLGMFPIPQFRFGGFNTSPTSSSATFGAFGSKLSMSTPAINECSVDRQKLQDPMMRSDNFNRKRTQIKNYQYDILRSYFNINNPPNDDTIAEIITKTGLDKKTVKHWFRNTLFKERQRCKDSPYNFSIPPETSLNIEEYEKTGKVEIKQECIQASSPSFVKKGSDDDGDDDGPKESPRSMVNVGEKRFSESECEVPSKRLKSDRNLPDGTETSYLAQVLNSDDRKSFSGTSQRSFDHTFKREPHVSRSEEAPLDLSHQSMTYNVFNGSRSSLTLDPVSPFESEQEQAENSNSMCGERRHRTTLTAMQIQAMKSIFIHCRSPSHGELGSLGSFLSLDMRVVQVWFQNQRAKLKKQERDMFYREKPLFPEAVPSVVDLPKSDRSHCMVCNQNISAGVTKQIHLFSVSHLSMLMRCLLTKSHDMKVSWKSVSEANSL